MKLSEKNFEATIEQSLLNHGYQKRSVADHDRAHHLIPAATSVEKSLQALTENHLDLGALKRSLQTQG